MAAQREFTEAELAAIEKVAPYLTQTQLGHLLGIPERTFKKMLARDQVAGALYQKARAATINRVAASLVSKCDDGNLTAIIFFLKCQAGWKEEKDPPVDLRALAEEFRRSLRRMDPDDADEAA